MQLDDHGSLVLSPSDLVNYLACEHLSELSFAVVRGEVTQPKVENPDATFIQQLGMEHERAYLATLEATGTAVEQVAGATTAERVHRTAELLRAGTPVVYQAAFFDPGTNGAPSWMGYADFVRRVETPSRLGPFSYEPDDTKLARGVKPSAVLQLCEYAAQIARIQGRAPEHIHVVLGGSERQSLRAADFSAYLRAAKRRLEEALAAGVEAYPWPVTNCAICAWRNVCDERRLADDHLTLVAGLTGEQARRMQAAGIATVAELAACPAPTLGRIGTATFDRLRQQARLQVAARDPARSPGDPPPYELLEGAGPGSGLAGLPAPDPADLFFDIEGDPFAEDGGLEYLLGVAWEEGTSLSYRPFWAHHRAQEKASFEAFIDFVIARLDTNPGMHIYHYAAYEPSALGRLMGRHATREEEVDRLLRAGVLVDLYQVVRQAVRVGTPSYSLKKLESLYMAPRTEAVTDGGSSIVEYERWVESRDQGILDDLAKYNEVDCDSTRQLRSWLEDRREDYAEKFGDAPPRPDRSGGEAPASVAEVASEIEAIKAALAEVASLAPAASDEAENETSATWLLGELLDWYRREEKPEWWKYYDRIEHGDGEELFEDTEAVCGLDYEGEVRAVRRSIVHRYRFDPLQEHKLALWQYWLDPVTKREELYGGPKAQRPGQIVAIDPVEGVVDLQRTARSPVPHPRALVPPGPLPTPSQREAVRRVARSVVEHGMDGDGPYRAVRDLLLRRHPRLSDGPSTGDLTTADEDPVGAAVRVALDLDGGCLAVQGPPGSGKTRTAARTIVELVRAGKRVGITANSHAVISHLLEEVFNHADAAGVTVEAAQKSEGSWAVAHDSVHQHADNPGIEAALDTAGVSVFAGTAWLFSRPAFEGRLDYLVVDEAGQLSLANVVAVGTAARNLILVGDPMQLAQPSKGTHPPGAETSALAHLLGTSETMPPDLGLFLGTTYRLHPEICSYISEVFYEGRLHAETGCELQAVGGAELLGGSGLRWLPVHHAGNRTSSMEEARVVKATMEELVGRSYTDRLGQSHVLALEDILVVAPYNAQVSLLTSVLAAGARIGTVDKFQGREAPVVIVSLGASSAEDVSRGLEFLYSRNRINVAVSRAQALSVLVASPALLSARCHTVDQLRLVNGLCRFAEMARTGPLHGANPAKETPDT